MDIQEILKHCDHTLLRVDITQKELMEEVKKAIDNQCASVYVPPCYVQMLSDTMMTDASFGKIPIGSIVGFPMGFSDFTTKAQEMQELKLNGVRDVDIVINISKFKSGLYDEVLQELRFIQNIYFPGSLIIKIVVESNLLSDYEKYKVCEIVNQSGATFLSTSTGCQRGIGGTLKDIELFKKYLDPKIKIKAVGNIQCFETAQSFLDAGASRIGESGLLHQAQQLDNINAAL